MHRLSPVAASRDYSLVVACGLLVAVAPLVAEHRALGMRASAVMTRGPSSRGSWA